MATSAFFHSSFASAFVSKRPFILVARWQNKMLSVVSEDSSRLFSEEINIIYDSKCNVCKLEIDFLRRRDLARNNGKARLKFTDLEGETGEYDSTDPSNAGITYEVGMTSMHGVNPDGTVMTGVPVFRKAYDQVGLGWLFAITKIPLVKQLSDNIYNIFARYRTRITRRASIQELVAVYEEKRKVERLQKEKGCETCPQ